MTDVIRTAPGSRAPAHAAGRARARSVTSGPRSPCATASRADGIRHVRDRGDDRRAATTPVSVRASRNAPNMPNGIAPATTIVRASPAWPIGRGRRARPSSRTPASRRPRTEHRGAPRRRERVPQRCRCPATLGSRRSAGPVRSTSDRDPIRRAAPTTTTREDRRRAAQPLPRRRHAHARAVRDVGEPIARRAAVARAGPGSARSLGSSGPGRRRRRPGACAASRARAWRRSARLPRRGNQPVEHRDRVPPPPVNASAMASPSVSTNALGSTHNSATAEYDLIRTRTRACVAARASAGDCRRMRRSLERGRPPVTHAAVGRDEHARADEPRPPAQVDVVGAGCGRDVEPAELLEQVGAHEHRRVRDEEDVAHAVVLFLVELARLDRRERHARSGRSPSRPRPARSGSS